MGAKPTNLIFFEGKMVLNKRKESTLDIGEYLYRYHRVPNDITINQTSDKCSLNFFKGETTVASIIEKKSYHIGKNDGTRFHTLIKIEDDDIDFTPNDFHLKYSLNNYNGREEFTINSKNTKFEITDKDHTIITPNKKIKFSRGFLHKTYCENDLCLTNIELQRFNTCAEGIIVKNGLMKCGDSHIRDFS